MVCRLIAPEWLTKKHPVKPRVLEGDFSWKEIRQRNKEGYNVYYLPNGVKEYQSNTTLSGVHVDNWSFVFVDYDHKTARYDSKDAFLEAIGQSGISPTKVIDSGNGIHVYWRISDLDGNSFLRLSRRLMRLFNTDDAVQKIFQLMRLPGTLNTKNETNFLPCEVLLEDDVLYTCEQLDKLLPPLLPDDEDYCKRHYDQTYQLPSDTKISDVLPPKFGQLLAVNHEAKSLWAGNSSDRSKDDYRLGHIMFASDFTKEEAISVLVNSAKAITRAPIHRLNYAQNIVDKIWTYETSSVDNKPELSDSVESILKRSNDTLKGTPFRCHKRIDNTVHGFRLSQVIGLVAGSGVGKTTFALNMFRWCMQENPSYHSFFIPLEQPAHEIADRWKTMTQGDTTLDQKVQILSNYDADGNFRHLSLDDIYTYIDNWQKTTGNKVGMVCIDHIGALAKRGSKDENQDLMTIMHKMKSFAVGLNVLLVMQSQSSREKAGIGDLELNKDAAYGSVFFESYCDFLLTLWQPLKRCHNEQSCPTVTAFKFCKIRHKKPRQDVIQEDVCYYFYFDSDREMLRDMSQDEQTSFSYFLAKATNKRKADRKTELLEYKSVPYNEKVTIATELSNSRLATRH